MPEIRANGCNIFYVEVGQGTPILFLQGLGADHSAWSPQLGRFGSDYRCIAPDNRDVGRSERSLTSYGLQDMANDMASLLAGLDIESAHVVGLSLGGAIAQHLALSYPHRVRSLTLVSTFARQGARQRELLFAWREIYAQVDRTTFYRQAHTWLFSDRFFERPRNVENVLRYVSENERGQEPAAFARQVEAALAHDTSRDLRTLKMPVLVVAGERDALVPREMIMELTSALPAAQVEILPDAPHLLNLERQSDFNRLLLTFMRRCDEG